MKLIYDDDDINHPAKYRVDLDDIAATEEEGAFAKGRKFFTEGKPLSYIKSTYKKKPAVMKGIIKGWLWQQARKGTSKA